MRSQRLALASGAIYVLAVMIGNGLFESGKTGAEDGAGVLADLRRAVSPAEHIGQALEMLGFTALLVFLGAMYRAIWRAERSDGWLAATALGAGLVTVAVKLGSVAPLMAAQLRADELTPDLARTLHDLGEAAFILSGYTTGIFVAAAAAAALATGVLPRWLGFGGVVIGVLTIAAGTAGVVDPGGYVPVPYLLGLVWVLAASVMMALRRTETVVGGAPDRASGPVPAGDARTA